MNLLKIVFILLILSSCKNDKKEGHDIPEVQDTTKIETSQETNKETEQYIKNSYDDALAKRIGGYITDSIVKKDIDFLNATDRRFQFYTTDLNGDQNKEIFVLLNGSYFCGSGGCTMLLLNSDLSVITSFTVMTPPLFIEKREDKDWAVLLIRNEGALKELIYKDGSYPSNPSILPDAPYDAPSGHAQIAFDDNFSKAKTYTF